MVSTSAPLSEAGIASMAAGLLDDYHVTSLDDNSPVGRYMAREFGQVRREILESHPWHIAKRRAVLSQMTEAPAFDWLYQYQLPTGCLRLLPPGCNGTFNEPPIPHEIESGKLLCNVAGTINVKYIFDERNVSRWLAVMGRAFAAKLAMYACQRITGKASYFDKCRTAYQDGMFEAKHVDSLTRGSVEGYYSSGFDGFDSVNVRGESYL